MDFVCLPGTQILGNHHAGTHGGALTECNQQVNQRGTGANGGQRIAAHPVSHNNGVHRVVHLLEQIAQNQRNGEQQQVFENAALGHQNGMLGFRHGCGSIL